MFYGYIIVAASTIIGTMMWGARMSFGVFFPPVLDEFGWSRAATAGGFSLSWVFTGFLSIFVGRLNNRFGPRLVMTAAAVLLGVGYLLMSQLNSMWQMYLFYGIVSVGMSAALVPIMSTVARWFTGLRASMSGVVLAGTGIALMFLLPAANQSIAVYGWRVSYGILGGACLLIIITAAQFLKRDPYEVGKLPYGVGNDHLNGAASPVSGITFQDSLRTNQVWLLGFVYFCSYFVYYVFTVHLVIHAVGEGFSSTGAVVIVSCIGAGGIAGRVLMGIFADKLGNKPAMMLSAGLMMLAIFWILVSKDLWMFYLFGVVFGFGHGGIATMESPMAAHLFGMRSHGTILGFVFFLDTIGGATGPVIAGYIYDVTKSYFPAFLLAAGIGILNLAAVLLLRPVKKAGALQKFDE